MDDYALYDKAHRECHHNTDEWLGAWKLSEFSDAPMYLCPDCGAVLEYESDFNPVRSDSNNDTLYVFKRTEDAD